MIFSKKIRKIFFGFICIFIVFSSKARLNSFEANDSYPWNCDTTGLYDANTTVTSYGDSRIDLADDYWVEGLGRVPFYGHVGLDSHLHLLGLDGGIWNVQNLGHSTWTTSNLLTHLRNCMQSQNGVIQNQKYLTSKNVAFEIGGNDFLFNTPVVSLTPWLLPSVADHALNNTEQIIPI